MSSHTTIPGDDADSGQLELGDTDALINLKKAWDRTLRTLAGKLNNRSIENFLKPLRPLSFEEGVAVFGAPSAFAREWADKKYNKMLRETLSQHLDGAPLSLRFVIVKAEAQPPLGQAAAIVPVMSLPAVAAVPMPVPLAPVQLPTAAGARRSGSSTTPSGRAAREVERHNPFLDELLAAPLNARFQFGNFVEGRSNSLALTGAKAVAKDPGSTYNPLFLFSNPGLGKTHLLHAIGHAIREERPEARVVFVSGENFANHYFRALRDRCTDEFRCAYRSVDVWLVDDIQNIASKEQTKVEFLHTFDALSELNRQVVITCDRPPRELHMMDERLRSRFESGLVTDIAAPDLGLRTAILQRKVDEENNPIPADVISFMANLIQSNIRTLEGARTRLLAYASLARSPITKQLASDVLSSFFVGRQGTGAEGREVGVAGATADNVIDSVAAQLGISRSQILDGASRQKDVAFARQAAMYLCREMTKVPTTTLAALFHCKNHSAIAHAHARMRKSLETDRQALAVIAGIRRVVEYSL